MKIRHCFRVWGTASLVLVNQKVKMLPGGICIQLLECRAQQSEQTTINYYNMHNNCRITRLFILPRLVKKIILCQKHWFEARNHHRNGEDARVTDMVVTGDVDLVFNVPSEDQGCHPDDIPLQWLNSCHYLAIHVGLMSTFYILHSLRYLKNK